jgi:predicted nucleic acid-binding protein
MSKQVIVDTSIWIRYLRGIDCAEVTALDSLIANDAVLLVPVLFQEILQGILSENEYQKIIGLLNSLKQYNDDIKPISILAANIYRLGQKKGVTIRKSNDCLVAAYCIFLGYPILHLDRDYNNIAKYTSLKIYK